MKTSDVVTVRIQSLGKTGGLLPRQALPNSPRVAIWNPRVGPADAVRLGWAYEPIPKRMTKALLDRLTHDT
jgi:hypothetical protein